MKNFICKACSNGCSISSRLVGENEASISGYQCANGVEFAHKYLSRQLRRNIDIQNKDEIRASPYSMETFSAITDFWNIQLKTIHPKVDIVGSPERTNFRIIIEDDKGEFFKLEKIFARALNTKLRILQTLEFLHGKGLKFIQPYRSNAGGEYIAKHEDGYWQITRFLKGETLNRIKYVFDGWRGKVLAEFLVGLREVSEDIPHFTRDNVFSLPEYIYKLVNVTKRYNPGVSERITPVVKFLEEEFFAVSPDLPVSFCHGDYHPLNVVWADKDVRAVIDWEFSGYKPEIYDIANLIGCLGVENPQSLQGDFVLEFIKKMRGSQIISGVSWKYLLEFVVATRFAWLSEWLRKNDYEMIELEQTYMKLLIENREVLGETWK